MKRAKRGAKKTSRTKRAGGRGKFRSLLANMAVTVHVPSDVSDKEVLSKLKRMRVGWTDPQYCTGPNGTVLDHPAGIDI